MCVRAQTTSCPASLSHRTASPGKSSSMRNSMPTGFQCERANVTTRSDFSTSLASNRHAAMSSRVTPGWFWAFCCLVQPDAMSSTIFSTANLVPLMTAFPPRTPGPKPILSCQCIVAVPLSKRACVPTTSFYRSWSTHCVPASAARGNGSCRKPYYPQIPGLFVVSTAVEHHRGTIQFGDSPLGGASFRLAFPRSQDRLLREQAGRSSVAERPRFFPSELKPVPVTRATRTGCFCPISVNDTIQPKSSAAAGSPTGSIQSRFSDALSSCR